MAALHSALQSLGPINFDTVPSTSTDLQEYLRGLFSKSQLIVESVPSPPLTEDSFSTARARSNTTTSVASNASEISSSSARSAPPSPEYFSLQKEWGKPIKLSAKENPLNMAVYKLGGKDGRGAWFARRSVHEGLGFAKWKKGLEREFPETMEVQGAPGEGNIRGIGGERRVERVKVEDTGKVEVYHLSAQFPGPTTPRDFVTMLVTSSVAINGSARPQSQDGVDRSFGSEDIPRHYMIISKPCIHPDCPPRDGFIRGNYESVEIIREVPVRPKKSLSSSNLLNSKRPGGESSALDRAAMLRNAEQKSHTFPYSHDNKSEGNLGDHSHLAVPRTDSFSDSETPSTGRRRGKTISYSESRGQKAKGEALDNPRTEDDEAEMNPVEWIMITRSDPGGSVPRWMVERGTPSSIVADAGKFLDWACQKEHPDSDDDEAMEGKPHEHHHEEERFHDYQANGHLAGLDGNTDEAQRVKEPPHSLEQKQVNALSPTVSAGSSDQMTQSGLLASALGMVNSSLEMYAPQVVLDHLPGHTPRAGNSPRQEATSIDTTIDTRESVKDDASSIISSSSTVSFASADSHFSGDDEATPSVSSKSSPAKEKDAPPQSPHERELAKLAARKKALDAKLAAAREKSSKDAESQTAKETAAIKKAEEKHAKDLARQEDKYKKEVAKLEQRKEKEAKKIEEKRKKQADKDERARLIREKDEMKTELDMLKKEREIWRNQVGELQKENTRLVARLGKYEATGDGVGIATPAKEIKDPLKSVREDTKAEGGGALARMRGLSFENVAGSGNRSRSGSMMRRSKESKESKDGGEEVVNKEAEVGKA